MPAAFPELKRTDRIREYNLYTDEERASVVYHWLFRGLTFREIDRKVLGLDPNISRGYQSMGIAHFLGLVGSHQGFFRNWNHQKAIDVLLARSASDPAYALIASYLKDYFSTTYQEDLYVGDNMNAFTREYAEGDIWINHYLLGQTRDNSTIDDKLLLMGGANQSNQSVRIGNHTYHYAKGAIKTAVKCLYDYHCQVCNVRIYRPGWGDGLDRRTQWRYLEADAHHIIPLSKGGPDKMNNILCLCPNCHRRFHSEEFELKRYASKLICENIVFNTRFKVNEKHPVFVIG